jgi:hypothetical protein
MERIFKIHTNEGYSYSYTILINLNTYLIILSSNEENRRYERVLNKLITDKLDQNTKISCSHADYLDLTFDIELSGIYLKGTVTIPYVGHKIK